MLYLTLYFNGYFLLLRHVQNPHKLWILIYQPHDFIKQRYPLNRWLSGHSSVRRLKQTFLFSIVQYNGKNQLDFLLKFLMLVQLNLLDQTLDSLDFLVDLEVFIFRLGET